MLNALLREQEKTRILGGLATSTGILFGLGFNNRTFF